MGPGWRRSIPLLSLSAKFVLAPELILMDSNCGGAWGRTSVPWYEEPSEAPVSLNRHERGGQALVHTGGAVLQA